MRRTLARQWLSGISALAVAALVGSILTAAPVIAEQNSPDAAASNELVEPSATATEDAADSAAALDAVVPATGDADKAPPSSPPDAADSTAAAASADATASAPATDSPASSQVTSTPEEAVTAAETLDQTLADGPGVTADLTTTGAADEVPSLLAASADLSALSAGVNGCSFADAGTGAYAQSLCWLDLTGFTTAYQEVSRTTTRQGSSTNPYRYRTTLVYASVLGSSYGSVTIVGTDGTSSNQSTAQSLAVSNAEAARSSYLYLSGSTYYGSVSNYPVTIPLSGYYEFSAFLSVTGSPATGSGAVSRAAAFPTYGGAFLGNTVGGNSFYTGVAGHPALYQSVSGGLTTATLSSIAVRDTTTAKVTDFSIVVADAETTDGGEHITWTQSNGNGFRWLPNNPTAWASATTNAQRKVAAVGNACPGTGEAAWGDATTTAPASPTCTGSGSSNKTGTPMLQISPANATSDFSVAQTMQGSGLQAIAFGLILGGAQVTVNVADRVLTSAGTALAETFSATMTKGDSVATATASGTVMSAATGPQYVPLNPTLGSSIAFATSASGAFASSYTASWVCYHSRTSSTTPERWPATGSSPVPPTGTAATVLGGEFLDCTVTYTPPYLTLTKAVDNAATGATNVASDFTLAANAPGASFASGAGSTTGTKYPVAVGTYALTESGPGGATAWTYGYDWAGLTCTANPGSTTPGTFTASYDSATGAVTAATLAIAIGNDVTCSYVNRAKQPQLIVSKDAFGWNDQPGYPPLDWGTPVSAGDSVFYRLTFDNSSGTAAAAVDYVDYLGDVLDDAQLDGTWLRISDGSEADAWPAADLSSPGIVVADHTGAASVSLGISGSVPRGAVRTVWLKVVPYENTVNAAQREAGIDRGTATDTPHRVGYALNNYLVEAGSPVPAACTEPVSGIAATCTHHPIPAWTFSKGSLPADGARLHVGGNVFYRLTATKLNTATDLSQLQFVDDLTHVFTTAGWAPDAVVPGGARDRGIYFFDEAGNSLDASGAVNGTASSPVAAYLGDAGVPAPTLVAPESADPRWVLRSAVVDVPQAAVRAEMWFAVQAGESPESIPTWSIAEQPVTGWTWVNYGAASSTSLDPNYCRADSGFTPDVSASPTEDDPADHSIPAACRTAHELQESFFTIRKDAAGVGDILSRSPVWGTDTTGLWNLIGQEFAIYDDEAGQQGSEPSRYLCWSGYDPAAGWDGTTWDRSGTADWSESSATLQAIKDYNNANDVTDPDLPLCGLLYAQSPGSGGQTGRWRSENLPAGDYWLVETRAPDQQISLDGTQTRSVPGVQLLAEPVAFTVWPVADEDPLPGGPSQHGRSQLDVSDGAGGYLARCQPEATVGSRPPACVNPTGYLMVVKNTVPLTLPLAGSDLTVRTAVGAFGLGAMIAVVCGAAWWRRRTGIAVRGEGDA